MQCPQKHGEADRLGDTALLLRNDSTLGHRNKADFNSMALVLASTVCFLFSGIGGAGLVTTFFGCGDKTTCSSTFTIEGLLELLLTWLWLWLWHPMSG